MDYSGTIIIPKGGVGLVMLDFNFNWVDRSQLIAINADGDEIEKIPSSFTSHIKLDKKVSIILMNFLITASKQFTNWKENIQN